MLRGGTVNTAFTLELERDFNVLFGLAVAAFRLRLLLDKTRS